RDDADHRSATAEFFSGRANLSDHIIELFENGKRLCAVGAASVLLFVEASEITGVKSRPFLFEQVNIESGAPNIAFDRVIIPIGVWAKRFLGFGEQSRSRQGPDNFAILGVLGAPVLNDVEIDVGAHGYRPIDARRRQARLGTDIPERLHFYV